ncbi:MAG: hypothetical protein ACXWT0_00210 [Methylobacter sp.]
MLTNIPTAINNITRNVIKHHPSTFDCIVVRKRVTRIGDATVGGLPTLGGMSVISSDDEEDMTWDLLGNGYAKKAEPFSDSLMMDRRDANNGAADEVRYLVIPETVGAFVPNKNDVFYLIIGNTRLAHEIVGIETTSDIPPYTQRFICNRRDDLHFSV